MSYMVFKHRVIKLEPSDFQAAELEKVFSAIRALHNLFVTQLQKFSDDTAKNLVRDYYELRKEIQALIASNPEEYSYLTTIPEPVLDSHIRIVGRIWKEWAAGNRTRPTFKTSKHRQGFWILEPVVEVTQREIFIPISQTGDVKTLSFKNEKPVLQGNPVISKIIRTTNHGYYLSALYEQQADVADPNAHNLINHWGLKLRETIKRAIAQQRNIYKRTRDRDLGPHDLAASLIRMDVLGKLSGPTYREIFHLYESNELVEDIS